MTSVILAGLDLNLLVVLDALLAESSVTRAAARIGLSQSATSHALGRLRALLDDPILVRTPQGMVPTARARLLAPPVRQALAQIERALAPPRPFDPGRSRRAFTLSMLDTGQAGLLPSVVRRLHREAPGVEIRVHHAAGGTWPEELEQGALDLALAVSPRLPAGFRTEVVFSTRYVSIARRNHHGVGRRLSLERFAKLGHIVLSGRGSIDPALDAALSARSLRRYAAVSVPSLLPIPWLVAQTDLIATVPEMLLELLPEHLPLSRHAPPIPIDPVSVSLVWHERTHDDPAQKWLRENVREICRELAAAR